MRRTLTSVPFVLSLAVAPAALAQGWQFEAPLPFAREDPAAVEWLGQIYALGGAPYVAGNGAAHVLGSTGWTSVAALNGGFDFVQAEVDELGRILVFGGEDTNGDKGEAYIWTPVDGDDGGIETPTDDDRYIGMCAATDAAGQLYAIGGGPGAAASAADPNVTRFERYDAALDMWSVLAPLPSGRADAAACRDGLGRVLVLGGFDAAGNRTGAVWAFDVATGSWSTTGIPDMPTPRNGHAAVLGADGRVYVVGGSDGSPLATVDVLDPATGAWGTAPSLAIARSHFGCTVDGAGRIWVLGGTTPTGPTELCESYLTPTCPSPIPLVPSVTAYAGNPAGLAVVATGTPPITYSWERGGVALFDGPLSSGATLRGTTTAELTIVNATAAEAGEYVCVSSNACGQTSSAPIPVTVREAPDLGLGFDVALLPRGASVLNDAQDVEAGVVVGTVSYDHAQYGTLSKPVRWLGNGTFEDLTPTGSVGGVASAIAGGTITGWWWWPYTVPNVGTGYNRHACGWTGPAATFAEMQPSGLEFGAVADTDGAQAVGGIRADESSTNGHGALWLSISRSYRSLTPPGAWGSGATGMDGPFQYGQVHHGFGVQHAARWSGTAASHFDMNPEGATASSISDAEDGLQIGRATIGGVFTYGVWAGTATSFTPLVTPGGASASPAATAGGLQVGSYVSATGTHAAVWAGPDGAFVDLHDALEARFETSFARGVDVGPNGEVWIVGSAIDPTSGDREAVLWTLRTPTFPGLDSGSATPSPRRVVRR